MRSLKHILGAALLLAVGATQAAGPLLLNNKPGNPQPLRWSTAQPVPVYTDLGVFTYDVDGVTPFITNQRAGEMVAFAVKQWNDVPSSTWRGYVAGDFTKVPSIGANVTADNVALVYGRYNGGGMHVVYDTDGRILEEYFGVPKEAVLGIAFPEFAEDRDGDGYEETIVEATALMNGYAVDINDPDGSKFTGIMTHEFGHALNLSHSQVNGSMAFFSMPGYYDLYPGVPGCVPARHIPGWGGNDMPVALVETMFPFISQSHEIGRQMSTVDMPDDIAAISNLYPAAHYRSSTGSISGVLRLKDGRTPYSGINVIARNINNPLGDAVSAMTGDQTQGLLGPDGRFTINNLKPGQQYWLYIEEIQAGGYPTTPRPLVSEAEYWNLAESSSPATDKACDATPITATAGGTARADLSFNGYDNGVQFYPVVNAYLTDLAKNGSRASGVLFNTQFIWDKNKGFEVMPANVLASFGSMSANGDTILVNADLDGNGIHSAALWSRGRLRNLGSLNGDRCGGDSQSGVASSTGFSLSDDASVAVGLAYVDADGDGYCQSGFKPEIVPIIWTEKGGMRKLDISGHNYEVEGWLRAQAVSGDGSVVLGETNYNKAMAWVNEGKRVDLFKRFGGVNAYAVNRDGSRVAMDTVKIVQKIIDGWTYEDQISNGVLFWNPKAPNGGSTMKPAPLRWCVDIAMPPQIDWVTWEFVDHCATKGAAGVEAEFGLVPVQINDMSDDGKVVVGRAGSFWYGGITGVMWLEGYGWIKLVDFFRSQGVAEAYRTGMDTPASLNGAGNEMVGGLIGVEMTWYVDMPQAHVCENGKSTQVSFPAAFVNKLKSGARMGRCEHQP